MADKDHSHPEIRYSHPFTSFTRIYKGQYGKLVLSIILFSIKHSPVWILPVVIARIIDIITDTSRYTIDDLRLVDS